MNPKSKVSQSAKSYSVKFTTVPRLNRLLFKGMNLLLAVVIGFGSPLSNYSQFSSANNQTNSEERSSSFDQNLDSGLDPNIYPPFEDVPYATDFGTPYQGGVPVPEKQDSNPISFEIKTDPSVIGASGEITFYIAVGNNLSHAIKSLVYTDVLESGMQFVKSEDEKVQYDEKSSSVTYSVNELESGATFAFSYTLSITSATSAPTGQLWVHTTQLAIDSEATTLKTEAIFWIGEEQKSTTTDVALVPANGGWVESDAASIYFPKNALSQVAVVQVTNLPKSSKGPDFQFEVDLLAVPELKVSAGQVDSSQKVELGNSIKGSLGEPAFMEIDFSSEFDLKEIPSGMEPYVATYDSKNDIWVKVPIVDIDYDTSTVTVKTDHFSTWGGGLGNSFPQNGAGALLFDQPYTSLFTGGGQYSVPIWTPPGRAGMSPDITLSYSSRTIDGVIGDVQAPWVGVGWNIDAVEIVRQIDTDENGYGYTNNFALTFNGELHTLLQDPNHHERYYTERASFLYIERHNPAFGNADGVANTTKEWWEVVATDGTRYRLGWNVDSAQTTLMYGYRCTTGNPCTTPETPYTASGYAGLGTNLVGSRWRVDQILDRHDNYISYSYTEEHPDPASQIPYFDRASYISTIAYTGHLGSQPEDPGYHVEFVLADRSLVGDVAPMDFGIWDQWDSKLLERINIWCDVCGEGGTLIRTYDFTYVAEPAPNTNGTLTLASLTIFNNEFSENDVTIPATSSATMQFSYENLANRAVVSPNNPWVYPRLSSISNGYGGILTYTYEQVARGTNSWHNYRISQAAVNSGLGTAAIRGYAYGNPVYTNEGGTGLGALVGYPTATETSYQFDGTTKILDIQHTFGTAGLDIGRELQSDWKNPSDGNVIRRTRNTYVTDNSQAPFSGWNFRYLLQQEQFEWNGSSLVLINKNVYHRDPGNGNLLTQNEYLGGNLYRKQTFEYTINADADVYILDRISRVTLRDSSNALQAETRNVYDSGLQLGDLLYSQSLTGENYPQSVDTGYEYDQYGNLTASLAFTSYGSAGSTPSGNANDNSIQYDPTLHTYPVTSTNALNQTTSSSYLFSLGLPYQVTDPNGWTNSTTYDGLGRVLSTTAPGFTQPNVLFSYPTPNANGQVIPPYSLQMQILDTLGPNAPIYRTVTGVYDGLSRMLEQQVNGGASGILITDAEYNAQGLVDRQSLPYLSGETPQYNENEYDLLGRTVSTTQPGNITTSLSYAGLNTSTTDPNGHVVTRINDGLGRMIAVNEYSGESPNTQLFATTQYNYDIADRLIRVQDDQNNITTITYDWLGRKTAMDDPDMGNWSYVYDPVGTLAQQTDARGQSLGFTYDALGRLTAKEDLSAQLTLATYVYDTSAGSIGFRTGMDDQSGATAWSYDNYGRTVTESRTVEGANGNYQFTTMNDWLGRVDSISYPDSDVVSYSYDGLGRPDGMASNQNGTLADLAYNALSQIEGIGLGNGLLIDNVYSTGNHRLIQRTASNNLIDFTYSYDLAGNITSMTDEARGENFSYTYDHLNRLLSADGFTGGQDVVYRQSFDYDSLGNILRVSNFIPPAPTSTPTETPSETFSVSETPTDTETPSETPTATDTQQGGIYRIGQLRSKPIHYSSQSCLVMLILPPMGCRLQILQQTPRH